MEHEPLAEPEGKMTITDETMFVGIDIAKDSLNFAVFPTGETERCAVNAAELADLAERLLRLTPQVVVMEATGGYQTPIAAALGAPGHDRAGGGVAVPFDQGG